jgi:hypothetical protein
MPTITSQCAGQGIYHVGNEYTFTFGSYEITVQFTAHKCNPAKFVKHHFEIHRKMVNPQSTPPLGTKKRHERPNDSARHRHQRRSFSF